MPRRRRVCMQAPLPILLAVALFVPVAPAAEVCPASQAVVQWKTEQVVQWLSDTVKLPQYSEVFASQEIDGLTLLYGLTDNELQSELGVKPHGHRKNMLRAIAQLQLCTRGHGSAGVPLAASSSGPNLQETSAGLNQQLYVAALEDAPDRGTVQLYGEHMNELKAAIMKELHEAGWDPKWIPNWPEVADLVHVSEETLDKIRSLGIGQVLQQRLQAVNSLRLKHNVWHKVSSIERAGVKDPQAHPMYATPGTQEWQELVSAAEAIRAYLLTFPKDIDAHVWARCVAFALADWPQVNSSLAAVYSMAHASARHVCSARPSQLSEQPLGPPHGHRMTKLPIGSEDCELASIFLLNIAHDWADTILLSHRDGASNVSLMEAALQAFEIRTRVYVDVDALQQFLVGPGFPPFGTFSFPNISHSSRCGLQHHQQQVEHLIEILQATSTCGSKQPASSRDEATAVQILTRFSGTCTEVVAQLRQAADAYGFAVRRGEESLGPRSDSATPGLQHDEFMLPADATQRILPYLNRHLHLDPAGAAISAEKSALSSPPGSEKWKQYEKLDPDEVFVIDGVFSPEALDGFLKFTERSTVFHGLKSGGYMCGYWHTGYAPPLFAQAYAELAAALPRVFCNHRLTQAWAYKYDDNEDHAPEDSWKTPSAGIGIHADEASVNVNCWLVPESSLTDAEKGGMLVWPTRPNVSEGGYNSGRHKTRWGQNESGHFILSTFLNTDTYYDLEETQAQRIPYKGNRCVIFDSAYYHATNKATFKKGFKNRRINLTFLAGIMHDTCEAVQSRSSAGKRAAAVSRIVGVAASVLERESRGL
ncbi:unnamed protein product [Polarella glacialis]|uniref:SAM domain-containing protein n=1 Tax=Polarella glacialis TaxID=89957 RepID=A0A813JPG0_POLGL|nr:unnamed protein product [Polarella glacialis]CAE8711714.1 unnamed protein product [Polarella glacialis]